MAARARDRLLNADQFLQIEFGPDLKAELDCGVIRMMAGGTFTHSRVQINLWSFLRAALRGSGCRPHGSDMAIRVNDESVRYPDLTIDCANSSAEPKDRVLRDPRVVIEVLSPSTRDLDLGVKLSEYRVLAGIVAIGFIDPDEEVIAVTHRTSGGG
ncbi:Uma2 family endonuclease [uncultured Sphingomonas sp.]|uniref:Uma2 family endonuclease n=1 Tax=uncultured Sphingomonas sp. TaxID=158754 RepID=UPI0035CC7447